MSVVRSPLNSQAASGSVGALTYKIRSRTQVCTLRAGAVYTSTPARDLTSWVAGELSLGWKALAPDQRATWNAWAQTHPESHKFGQVGPISGHNWYCRLGSVMLRLGNPPISEPAPAPAWPALLTLNVSPDDPGVGALHLPDYPGPSSTFQLDMRYQPVLSPGRRPLFARSLHFSYEAPESQYLLFPVPGPGRRPLWLRYLDPTTGHLSHAELHDLTWL